FRPSEVARICQQLMREDGSEMLKCHGRRETDDWRPASSDRQPPLDALFELRQVVSRRRRALVEGVMLAAVDCFLGGEALDLLGELGRRSLPELAHAFDEEGFAGREGR